MIPGSVRERAACGVSWWFHALAFGWVTGMLAFARAAPEGYYAAMQEDRATEWATAAFFLVAAVVTGRAAWRRRRVGDLAVAAFCFVAAGEEISWGQRVLGFTPPEAFLANNAQQEANLHNLVEAFGQPKWSLIAVLVAYGIIAPLLMRLSGPAGRLGERIRFAPPPLSLVPWFGITVGLMVLYPVRFTGEWAEALAGALFLASRQVTERALALAVGGIVILSPALESLSARPLTADPGRVACARAEVTALAGSLARDGRLVAGTRRRVHRRLWSLVREGAVETGAAPALTDVACAGSRAADDVRRRAYFVDPWGTAYWVRIAGVAGRRTLTVYSFGPNRRRDVDDGAVDDIVATEPMLP